MQVNLQELLTTLESHSVESRLSKVEERTETHAGKISYLERAVQFLIWAVVALASSKSGDVVDAALAILKAKT